MPYQVNAPADLTDDEHAELVRLLRDAIAGERYVLSPRMKRLKSLLAKVDPASVEATVEPFPAPRGDLLRAGPWGHSWRHRPQSLRDSSRTACPRDERSPKRG